MTNKALYLIIGILAGVIAILAIEKSSFSNSAFAADKSSVVSANNTFIAIGSMTKIDNNLLWLVDTNNKKLTVYEYAQDNLIRLRAARDIQYDIDIPNGVAMPLPRTRDEGLQPLDVKKLYDEIREQQEKARKKEQPKENTKETPSGGNK